MKHELLSGLDSKHEGYNRLVGTEVLCMKQLGHTVNIWVATSSQVDQKRLIGS